MTRHACPICGDPSVYVLWCDPVPPAGCPEGDHVKDVTMCRLQMAAAKQAAEWRKLCPEAFDTNGNIKPGGLALVLAKIDPETRIII